MTRETGERIAAIRQREGLSYFREVEARRETAEFGAVAQRKDGLQAAEGELAGIKNEVDGNLDTVRTAFTEVGCELHKIGRERLLGQTVEPQRKADAEPLAELDQYTRAALQAAEGLTQEVNDLVRWREAQVRRRQAMIIAGIAVALVVMVLVAFTVYSGFRQVNQFLQDVLLPLLRGV